MRRPRSPCGRDGLAAGDAWIAYVERASRRRPAIIVAAGAASSSARSAIERRYLAAASEHGGIVGVLPLVFFQSRLFGRFAVSLPFVNYGGVVADDAGGRARAARPRRRGHARARRRRISSCGTREQHFPDLAPKRHKVAMLLPLAADRRRASGTRSIARCATRCARPRRAALEPSIGGVELLRRLLRRVRAQHARPRHAGLRASASFEEVLDAFPDRRACSSCASRGPAGRRLARALARRARSRCRGRRRCASSTRCAPTCSLLDDAAASRSSAGFAVFDFGRSTPNEGTFHFKKQWGAQPRELVLGVLDRRRARVPDLSPKNPKFHLAIRVWQRLPVRGRDGARPAHRAEHPVGLMLALLLVSALVLGYVLRGLSAAAAAAGARCAGARSIRQRRHHAGAELGDLGLQRGRRHPRASSRTRWRSTIPRDLLRDRRRLGRLRRRHRRHRPRVRRPRRPAGAAGRTARQDRRAQPHACRRSTGDVVVFSDANAMYERGCAAQAGAQLRRPGGRLRHRRSAIPARRHRRRPTSASAPTGTTRCRSSVSRPQLGSMVGGDGAIYAIRRRCGATLPEDAINDFLNPLQIVEAGWRARLRARGGLLRGDRRRDFRSEYRRRVRIVSRSWRAVFQAPGVLNPFRVGLFSWCLVSHKMLRWTAGFVCGGGGGVGAGAASADPPCGWPAPPLQLSAAIAAVAAITPRAAAPSRWPPTSPSSTPPRLIGVAKGTFGRVSGVWSTPRQEQAAAAVGDRWCRSGRPSCIGRHRPRRTGRSCAARARHPAPSRRRCSGARWPRSSTSTRCYPLLLLAARGWPRGARSGVSDVEPSVCLFIAANDEAGVIEAKLRERAGARLSGRPAADRRRVGRIGRRHQRHRPALRAARPAHARVLAAARQNRRDQRRHAQQVTCDIVVFSDANTFLEPDAVRALVRNFARTRGRRASAATWRWSAIARALGQSEDLYYRYERWMQHAESDIGSMIGADGALYAIRRELFAAAGRRHHSRRHGDSDGASSAPDVGSSSSRRRARTSRASESAREEFARKTRVVAGAMQFLARNDSSVPLTAPQVILSLVSHKALRWLSPAFAPARLRHLALPRRHRRLSPIPRRVDDLAVAHHGVRLAGRLATSAASSTHRACRTTSAWCRRRPLVGFLEGSEPAPVGPVAPLRARRRPASRSPEDTADHGRSSIAESAALGARRHRASGQDGTAAHRRLRRRTRAVAQPLPRHPAVSRDLRGRGLPLRRPADLHHPGELRAPRRLPLPSVLRHAARRRHRQARCWRGAAAKRGGDHLRRRLRGQPAGRACPGEVRRHRHVLHHGRMPGGRTAVLADRDPPPCRGHPHAAPPSGRRAASSSTCRWSRTTTAARP